MGIIAVLGAGAMGSRVAHRLLSAGHELRVYNRSAERTHQLASAGAIVANTPAEAAAGAELVMSIVTDDEASREVWLEPRRGALVALASGAVALECSTVTLAHVDALGRAAGDAGVELLDAPMVGSRAQAEVGSLIYLIGGSEAGYARVRDVLPAAAAMIHHVGPRGSAMALKLAANALFAQQVAALAEVLRFSKQAGLASEQVVAILGSLSITSPALQGIGSQMLSRAFAPQLSLVLAQKELEYLVSAAKRAGVDMPLSEVARRVYGMALARGLGDLNVSAVCKLYDD